MNNIEMTDVDGDALTLITREDGTWITCTSGRDEVTVGPFPTRLVRAVVERGLGEPGTSIATLLGHTGGSAPARSTAAHEAAPSPAGPDGTGPSQQAELAAAGPDPSGRGPSGQDPSGPERAGRERAGRAELAAELRGLDVTLDDPDALADHLMTLGYRKP